MPSMPTVTISQGLLTDQGIIANTIQNMMLNSTVASSTTSAATLLATRYWVNDVVPSFVVTGVGLTFSSDETLPAITGGTITGILWELRSGYTVTFTNLNIDGGELFVAANAELLGTNDAVDTLVYALDWAYFGNSVPERLVPSVTTLDGVSAELHGNNFIATEFGQDTVFAGAGNDTVNGGRQNDFIDGGIGDDRLRGNDGFDVIFGRAGADFIQGNFGYDSLMGGNGDDTIQGNTGNDTIRGGYGDDDIGGGSGRDELRGEWGNDTVIGFGGRDKLFGGDGDDLLEGRLHDDTLLGEQGNDTLIGGDGNDYLSGGAGADVFVFSYAGDANFDRIADFDAHEDTIVLLDGVGYNLGTSVSGGVTVEFANQFLRIDDIAIGDLNDTNLIVTTSADFFGFGGA